MHLSVFLALAVLVGVAGCQKAVQTPVKSTSTNPAAVRSTEKIQAEAQAKSKGSKEAKSLDLERYRGEKRLLLLFAPSPENDTFLKQVDELSALDEEVAVRDLVLIKIFDGSGETEGRTFSGVEADPIWKEFQLSPDATVGILIEKDGTEKWRRPMPLDLLELFDLIDAINLHERRMRKK